MLSQHMSQQSFADVVGISPASLSSIFNDRQKPTLNHVDAIKKKFPSINLDWLLYGRGPMYLDEQAGNLDENAAETKHSTPQEQGLFSATDPPQQGRLDFGAPKEVQNSSSKGINSIVKNFDKTARKITEIRIFYDDQTWETFVPKKS